MDANSNSAPAGQGHRRRSGALKATVMIVLVTLCVGAIVWVRPAHPPPVISLDLLGYTNRVGPHALLAITNRSDSTITLDARCQVEYAANPSPGPRLLGSVISVDANIFRVTQLRPNEGFVQEFFVSPAGNKSDWKFVYFSSYKSTWLEARRFAETWVEKQIRHSKWPPKSKTWHVYNTEWFTCPP